MTLQISAKEWLERARGIDAEIEAMLDEKAKASARSAIYAKASCSEYLKCLDKRIHALYEIKQSVLEAIDAVQDTELRALLAMRYIRFLSWEKIEEKLHKSVRWLRTAMHDRALAEIEKYLREKGEI